MILVTGATGFVGSRVLARLEAAGESVCGLARRLGGDLTKPETLPPFLEGAEIVIHAAAITGDKREPYKGAYDRVNRQGTENLAAAAKAAGVKRLVVVSGLGCKPAPEGTYMATRWGLEEAVRQSGIPYVILQPSVLFGEGAPFVTALEDLARRSPVLPALGGGGTRFQPLWVEDLVTSLQLSCTRDDLLGQEHPLGGAEILTFKEILRVIARRLGKRRLIVPVPLWPNPALPKAALELFSFDNATALDSVERRFGFKPKGFTDE
ncbi:MAG TPA: NAD-dependent epimerase/dehydratase family protein [Candidatus Dormibacteraeota bacterium]